MSPLLLAACFAAGFAAGMAYFLAVWLSARRIAGGESPALSAAFILARFALLGGMLALASLQGALPLLVTAAGLLAARPLAMRRFREAAP